MRGKKDTLMAKELARQLRKNMTDAERCLWQHIRNRQLLGYKFRRQHELGTYIVDFVCLERKIILEVDGGQHIDRVVYDQKRTDWLTNQGFWVFRFWNNEVLEDTKLVLEMICKYIDAPSSQPSPNGRRS